MVQPAVKIIGQKDPNLQSLFDQWVLSRYRQADDTELSRIGLRTPLSVSMN